MSNKEEEILAREWSGGVQYEEKYCKKCQEHTPHLKEDEDRFTRAQKSDGICSKCSGFLRDLDRIFDAVKERCKVGALEYGSKTLTKHPEDLLGEIEEEFLDVIGYAVIGIAKMRRFKALAQRYSETLDFSQGPLKSALKDSLSTLEQLKRENK